MNKGLFRLIFSTHLGMFVPAAESVVACAGRSAGNSARSRRRALAAILALSALDNTFAAALDGLVPGGGAWVGANALQTTGNVATIQQIASTATLNFLKANLRYNETLNINQLKDWQALIRINDINPSTINGSINAAGHLYLINSNGIIFGNGAQINAGSLTASTLDIADSLFNNGILSDPTKAVFSGTGGFVTVEQGASLTSATGGRVMLLAKNVTNNGVISTPDGQTILAAGEKVYLADSTDPSGLLIEVDAGGTAKNLGEIVAQRGNVTLVGLAVNQEGRISASTSVRANGSIHLLARDTVINPGTAQMSAQRGGVVTLGEDSTTTIAVETDDKEEVLDAQALNPSRVLISGGVIDIEGSIVAHGGEVSATAAFNPSNPGSSNDEVGMTYAVDATRIYLGEHALIDVSGVDASAPMSRNQLEIQLYSDQLKDAPLQRGGPLFGQVIYVDARKGTALTDIQPYLDLKGKTIAERMASGGTVNLTASVGDVVMSAGSEVGVSGGSVTYEAGRIKESTLSYKGKTIAISQADPNIPYENIADTYSVTDQKWGVTRTWALNSGSQATLGVQGSYNAAYSEGRSAGTVNINAANAGMQGGFTAATKPGYTQRSALPAGGAFNFTLNTVTGITPAFRLVADNPDTLPDPFSVVGDYDADTGKFVQGDALPDSDILLGNELFADGFSNFTLNSVGGAIAVDAAIKTAPKGTVTLTTAGQVTVNADIVSPGGTITISGSDTALADHVTISAAGLFTNDTPGMDGALQDAVALNGGNVVISGILNSANNLILGQGSLIDTSAGAWLNSSGKLSGGNGGNITLNGIGELQAGQVQSYGFAKGGTLSLNTFDNVQIGGQDPAADGTLWLPESWFRQGGFSKYSIVTSTVGSELLVGDHSGSATLINPIMQTLVTRGGYAALASGASMKDVASPALAAPSARSPVSMSFKSLGALTVSQEAIIQTDAPGNSASAGGSIDLQAQGQLTILGSLIAPAGSISAAITGGITGFAYDDTLSLFIGDTARLLAAGYYSAPPSNDGNLIKAKVLNGGTITLDGGERGVVVAKQGSLLDVSAVSGLVDIANANGYTRQTLYGSAGSINISSRNALVLDGDLNGNADGTGAGGTLTLNIKGNASNVSDFIHPSDARTLSVTQGTVNRADGLNPGDTLDSVIGQGAISAQQIAAGGFDRLTLGVDLGVPGDKIVLHGELDLNLPASLTLDAAMLEVSGTGIASVAAPYILLTNSGNAAAPALLAGDAILKINADFIDLINSVTVTNVASTQLSAVQDIRGRGNQVGVAGSLTAPGELVLSARQIYPVTNSAFTIEAAGTGSSIEVRSSGETPAPVLSAGGQLTLKADEIVQDGALRAPLGQITLDAANRLTLGAGSLTSVSSEGLLIPYGLTGLGGLDWFTPGGQLVASDSAGITALPEKKINLKSANVNLQAGATVDISGSGDVLAYEFIQGIGGSQDILGQAGVYAVMPSMQGEYAPFDYSYSKIVNPASASTPLNTDLKPGDAIYLSEAPGLPAGFYTLLPGRYALLPGAFMVQTGNTALSRGQSVAQLDGSTLVSGYRTILTDTDTNRDTQWATFRVTDGNIFHPAAGTISKAPAEYLLTTGNEFFRQLALDAGLSVPRLAADAGQLTLDASAVLTLGASILMDKASDARGALVDIVSGSISVVSDIGPDNGTLQLTADALNALNAESLLLGGTRTQTTDGTNIVTTANSVVFANDAAHALEVPELIATATDTLTVNTDAAIGTLATTQPTGTTRLHASGDGALLAVSALNDLEFDRSGVSANPASGTLDVVTGANVQAGRSLVLDSTLAASLNGNIDVSAGGSATLGANRILMGDAGNEAGLLLNDAVSANLGGVAKLTLNSITNLDIYGPVSFGNSDLNLTVNAGGIAGHLADNQAVMLTANDFVLENSAGATYLPPADATGAASSLDINAKSITFAGNTAANTSTGAGIATIGGFDTANLNATGKVLFKDTGSIAILSSQTNIASARINAATGTDFTLAATGALSTADAIAPDTLPDAGGLGAKLRITASSMNLGGNVELPSGQFTAQTTDGDLTVAQGAVIKTASIPVTFDKFTEYTPGGSVTLQANTGNIVTEAGSTIDVSGGIASDAGIVQILATNGSAILDGTLNGQAGAGQIAGSFVLDTKTLPDFSALNTGLNEGGFTASRDMRVRNGDVAIAAGDTVTAHRFVLSADAGKIDIAGTVNADGANGGDIGIYARDSVTLDSTGRLLARGMGDTLVVGDATTGAGGSVILSSLSTASIDAVSAESGALIDVSGDQQGTVTGNKGSVALRAYRGTTGNTNTVNVAFGTTAAITGADQVRVEGVKVYNSATFAANTSTVVANTNAFYTANPGAGSYAATMDEADVSVLPGIEVRSTGTSTPTDLTISADLNMRAFGALQVGKGGALTLRSNNNLNVNGSLSDGFSTATTAGFLQTGNTFTYQLVAGADFSAANPMATVKGTGNFSLASNKLIRTGTGDILIGTGGNLTMGNDSSVIYTVGQAADGLDGFTAPSATLKPLYLENGGDISIRVQGNINGSIASVAGAQQLINHWLFRQGGGTSSKDVSWWVRPDLFKQGVAAFGGGDVTINSGGNITNFSASVPTTGRYDSYTVTTTTDPDTGAVSTVITPGSGNYSVDGGGNLAVHADGNIKSGVYYSGRGNINLTAGGEIGAATNTFGTTLALQDASASVSAVKNAAIETVFNPTLWAQATANVTNALITNGDSSFFLTYGKDSAFRLDSLTGNVSLGLTNTGNITGDLAAGLNGGITSARSGLEIHPPTVEARAFGGNINVGRLVLAPAAQGNLSLLAAGDVKSVTSGLIAMSDADADIFPSVTSPLVVTSLLPDLITQLRTSHAGTPVHLGDEQPLVIVARDGSILLVGDTGSSQTKGPGLFSPKAAFIHAGMDISLNADLQHVGSNDVTVVEAGRDFVSTTKEQPLVAGKVQLGGPGELLVEAGRNVSLGESLGIVSAANTINPALSDEGASITVLAGLGKEGADLAEYVAAYIDPAGAGPEVLQDDSGKLADYRQQTAQAVTAYMQHLSGNDSLSDTDAMAQYLSLDEDRQAVFAYRHFSSELLASGKSFATSGNDNRGDNAIAMLFPAGRNYDGDLALFNSQLRTLRGGSIDILTPGGFINAGVPTSAGDNIGIVTEKGGDIRAFAETGFQVEQSKVITQFGGDITVWVNNGDIDAGRGSKTAVSVPKRVVSTDADGNTTVEVKGVATGSGIRAQTYDPDGPSGAQVAPRLGNVALLAPRGVLNASEAGVAAGDFIGRFSACENCENITVSGISQGVPQADTGSLAGSLAGVSNVASDAGKAGSEEIARQVVQSANNPFAQISMPSFITVDVIGLGE